MNTEDPSGNVRLERQVRRYPSRVFEHPNIIHGFECPICRTGADAPVVLVGIPGTEDDGIVECKQVHQQCYDLVMEMQERAHTRLADGEIHHTAMWALAAVREGRK